MEYIKIYAIRFVYMFLFMLFVPNLLALLPFLDRFLSFTFASFGIDFIKEVIKASIMALGFALCLGKPKPQKSCHTDSK